MAVACSAIPYQAIYLTISYQAIYLTISYLTISYKAIPYQAISYQAISYQWRLLFFTSFLQGYWVRPKWEL